MTVRTPGSIIKILIISSFFADALLLALLSFYHTLSNNSYTLTLFVVGAIVLAYLSLCAIALRIGRIDLGAKLILFFYYLVAVVVSISQGITSSISLLLYCFFILIGGVLMGSTYIVRTTLWSIASLFGIQIFATLGLIHSVGAPSTIAGIAAYSILFGVFALIGWLAASQIERALHESLQAKAEMLHQKNLLAQALASEEYRRQQLQIEELGNLYQFAELGQQTTLLMHEFANQLTTLSLELEDPTPHSHRHALATLKEMNQTMQIVREKLTTSGYEVVSVSRVLSNVIKEHRAKLQAAHIKLQLKVETAQHQPVVYGDSLKLQQILNILIDNAIQAYEGATKQSKRIIILLATTQDTVTISVTDYGAGISAEQRKRLFTAHHSTKVGGHGIGLYIAKRIIEHQFQGTLQLRPATDSTNFVIELRRIG